MRAFATSSALARFDVGIDAILSPALNETCHDGNKAEAADLPDWQLSLGTTIAQKLIACIRTLSPGTNQGHVALCRSGTHHDEFARMMPLERSFVTSRSFSSTVAARGGGSWRNTFQCSSRAVCPRNFPDAIFLYITRNPFSCISSMELKWKKQKLSKGYEELWRSLR